jgi:hypothetical protein
VTAPADDVMAYVDGELDAEAARAFAARLAADPALAERVERERALRRQLRAAYDPVLAEPVPAALAALLAKPARADDGVVVDFASERSARAPRRVAAANVGFGRWAMAASALVGVAAGLALARFGAVPGGTEGNALLAASDGAWIARGALDDFLTHGLGADTAKVGDVRVGLSFVDRDGRYCRAFALPRLQSSAGVACRSGSGWRVEVLAATDATSTATAFRTAASTWPAAVVQAIDARRAGDMLDADTERAARDHAWRR